MDENLQRRLVHKKENVYLVFAILFSLLFYIVFALSVVGIVIILLIALISYLFHAISMAQIRRNAVKISSQQFPDIYVKAATLSNEMGLKKVPAMYVIESMGMMNAFATRFFGKNMVIVYSEIFDLIESEQEDEMMFVLAHEFAHLKRRHVLLHTLILPSMWIPFLGEAYMRACEYTCDRYGAYYTKNMKAAHNALTILAIGKKLHYRVNQEAYMAQLEEEKGFFHWLSEKLSTHPDLPKRMNSLYNWQNPSEHSLFKERKRNIVIGLVIPFVIIPAVVFGVYYTFEKIDGIANTLWEDEGFDDDYTLEGYTDLMGAASSNALKDMRTEIENGADVNAVDSENWTALHYATDNLAYEAIELLIQSGSNLNIQDSDGDTPLILASMYGYSDIVELLVNNEADQSVVNKEGYTAYDYAVENNQENEYKKIINLLAK
ncbi:M48 family metallopeptidase [Bacillus massiliigorillae]|uniref:M48 family metallopeptidase n=1 Tax=Bacillus massiliigorillae TaxID=1243664 RepID=UPI0003A1DE9C|nr:M48 family metallopeptidase [Bacillus massiliigorillae]